MDHYFTIEQPAVAEYKYRGSKFIAFAYPVDHAAAFKKQLQLLKKEHPKAVHHCFAYRFGITGDNFRVSDDGEPSGTAGKPILGQIDSKQLLNVAIVVVRYFGGTLLGVPGLINAYKTASSLALQTVPVVKKPILISYSLEFDYTFMNEVMMIIKQFNCQVIKQDMQLFSYITIGVPKNRETEVIQRLTELRNVSFKRIL